MRVLSVDCLVPGWCSFRIPHSVNVHLTYPAPPPSTIYGLIANALGLAQDDYSLRPQLKIGVRILKRGSIVESYSRWMKWNPSKNSMIMMVTRQKIIQPAYRFFLTAESSLLEEIKTALEQPARILYLGESDDVVELINLQVQTAQCKVSNQIDSVAPYEMISKSNPIINTDVSVVHWPLAFEHASRSSFSVKYGLAYVSEKIELESPIPCWWLPDSGEYILLEGDQDEPGSESEAVL